MTEAILTVEEVAVRINVSLPTIASWYRWKRCNPGHEMADLLPDFFRVGPHKARRWYESDIEKLIEFKNSIPQGRNGIMGEVTQKYVKKNNDEKGYIKETLKLLDKHNVDTWTQDFIRELLEEDFNKRDAA